MSRTIIAVDFDGTIVEAKFPKVGAELPGATWWLRRWQEEGALLILLTMRSDGRADGTNPLSDAVEFCRSKGVEFWQVNENKEQDSWTGSRKVYAHIYVDDAGAIAPLDNDGHIDWHEVGPWVLKKIRDRKAQFAAGS